MKEKTIDYILRTTWLAVQKMYNEEASKFDATMATAFTLLSIDPKIGTSSTSLGPKMGMESTSLSRILKTLEDRDLIKRTPNPEDGRGIIINLTKLGLEKREAHRAEADTLMLRDLYRKMCLDLAKNEKIGYEYVWNHPEYVWNYINN